MLAKISPTSPRGIMPMPIDSRSSPRPEHAERAELLADDGRDGERGGKAEHARLGERRADRCACP